MLKLTIHLLQLIAVAINQKFAGYFLIADEIKEDAKQALKFTKINIKTNAFRAINKQLLNLLQKN